jgi:ribosomal protein S2
MRDGLFIIDLEQTLIMLKRALNLVRKVCLKRGYIYFLPSLKVSSGFTSGTRAVGASTSIQNRNSLALLEDSQSINTNTNTNKHKKISLGDPKPKELKNSSNSKYLHMPSRVSQMLASVSAAAFVLALKRNTGTSASNKVVTSYSNSETSGSDVFLQSRSTSNFLSDTSDNLIFLSQSSKASFFSSNRQQRDTVSTLTQKKKILNFHDFSSLEAVYPKPEIIFILETHLNKALIKEAVKLRIPIIGILNTTSTNNSEEISYAINYPIPGNNDSIEALSMYSELLINTIIDTKKMEILSFSGA